MGPDQEVLISRLEVVTNPGISGCEKLDKTPPTFLDVRVRKLACVVRCRGPKSFALKKLAATFRYGSLVPQPSATYCSLCAFLPGEEGAGTQAIAAESLTKAINGLPPVDGRNKW